MQNSLQEKLEARFIPEPNSGCYLWLGTINDSGYGLFGVRIDGVKRQRRAHRLYYELMKGPVPKDKVLDHLCRLRCCVNPDHLEICTSIENVMRGESLFADQVKRTHCPYGHSYAGDNLFFSKRGGRLCRTCDRAKALKWHYANRDRSNAKRKRNMLKKKGKLL